MEGIWSDGGLYEAGIVATGHGQYKAFLLRADSVWWMPGQVKFALTAFADSGGRAVYYMRDHSARRLSFDVAAASQGALRLAGLSGAWYRQYPAPVAVPAPPQPALLHSFRMLDDTTALYRLGSFDGNYRSRIDSLTKAHAADLRRTRLLILDLRDNGGGSDGSFRSLEPLLYTGPVRTVGVALWSTEENNRKYDGQLYPNMTWGEKRYFARLKRRLEAHRGQFVAQHSGSPERVERGRRRPAPAQVAVLQNRNVGSTTEQFLLLARQSEKTTLFGENSGGVLDYANMHFVALPCYKLRLGWATSRSYRLDRGQGVDNVGIAPQVRLDPAAPDLVEQVQAWYRRPR